MIVSNINYIILYYENCIGKIFFLHYFRLIQISKILIIILLVILIGLLKLHYLNIF